MNKISTHLYSVLLLVSVLAIQANSAEVVGGQFGKKIDQYMKRLTDLGYSGGVLAVKDGKIVISKGYGFANEKLNKPFTTTTVFPIGSVTKPFTSTAVMTLVMAGKINVDDSMAKYLEHVPADKRGITIHHLLTHSSGLPSALGGDFDTSATKDWLFQEAMGSRLQWKPGKKYDYSNVGFSLLGMIIEKVSGKSYEQYLRDHVLKPAGMMKTGYVLPQFQPDELAVCYQEGEPWGTMLDRAMLDDGPCWNLRCNGGLHSTIDDMYGFLKLWTDDKVLSNQVRKKAWTPHVGEGYGDSWYGYGWTKFITRRGTAVWTHNGGDGGGYSAMIHQFVDENVMIFTASNTSEFIADHVNEAIASYLFNSLVKMPPESIKLDPTTLTALAGTYELDNGDQIVVSRKKNRLSIAPLGQDALLMLSTGRKPAKSKLQKCNQRTAAMIEKSAKGDYSLAVKAFKGMIPPDQVENMERQLWSSFTEELGSFQGVTILGSTPHRMGMGMIATIARFDFERGSKYVRYGWMNNKLQGVRPQDGPPVLTYYPKSSSEFFSFKLGSPQSVMVQFTSAKTNQPPTLIVKSGRKETTARKIQ